MSYRLDVITTEIITPDAAARLLAKNTHNRPVHGRHVERLASAMTEGRWQFNGETIKIAMGGTLVDGQHRLMACVKSGVPFETVVVRNLPLEIYPTVDTGAKRTGADALGREGIKNSAAVAGSVRWIKALEAGKASIGNVILDPDQVISEVFARRDLEASAQFTSGIKIATPSVCTALHFLFSKKNREQADAFFNDLRNGEGLVSGDPVLLLRNKLIETRLSSRMKKHASSSELVALIIRAWNARRTGRSMALIKGLVRNDAGEMVMPTIL